MNTDNNSLDEFEVFIKGRKTPGKQAISLTNASNSISFNSSFIKENNLAGYGFVTIYTKKELNMMRLAFEFAAEEGENGFKLSHSGDTDGRFVSSKSLFNYYKIDQSKIKKRSFEPKEKNVGEKKMFIIEIPLDHLSNK
jgi:hypothetical protein